LQNNTIFSIISSEVQSCCVTDVLWTVRITRGHDMGKYVDDGYVDKRTTHDKTCIAIRFVRNLCVLLVTGCIACSYVFSIGGPLWYEIVAVTFIILGSSMVLLEATSYPIYLTEERKRIVQLQGTINQLRAQILYMQIKHENDTL